LFPFIPVEKKKRLYRPKKSPLKFAKWQFLMGHIFFFLENPPSWFLNLHPSILSTFHELGTAPPSDVNFLDPPLFFLQSFYIPIEL